VRISNVHKAQSNSYETIGIVIRLTKEGFLIIKTQYGKEITHVSGDIIELTGE